MKTEQAIRNIMEIKGKRFMDVAMDMGIATNTFAGRLKAKNISVEKLSEILDVLGYKIVLLPESDELNPGEFEIR